MSPGLYGPGSEAWRLNREAMLLLGAGPRALLLQIAHPAVAAGVNDHSDFRADPWRRLAGTLRSYLTIVYGSTGAARAEIRRLNTLHRGITGPGYARPRPRAVAVGPCHPGRLDDGRRRRVAGAAVRGASRDLLRGDATDRAGIRRPRRAAAGRRRRVRPRMSRRCSRPTGRSGSRRSPASSPRSSCGRRSRRWPRCCRSRRRRCGRSWRASRPPRTPGRCGRRSACCRRRSATTTACRGVPRERLVSAWLVAGFRAWRPLLPASFRQMPKALAADRRMAGGPR